MHKSGFYHVEFYDGTRTRVLSTKMKERKDAARVVRESGFKQIELMARAGELRTAAISTMLHGNQKVNCLKLMTEWESWMRSYGRSDATILAAITTVKAWLKLATLEQSMPGEITEQHVDDYVNRLDNTKVTTRKLRLAHVSSFIKWTAVKYRQGNPADNVRVKYKQLSHEQKEKEIRHPFTDEEFNKLLAAMPLLNADQACFWTAAIWIGKTTGLRLGDVCCLEWASFNTPGFIEVWTRKRDKKVKIPLDDNLLAAMLCAEGYDETYCFPSERRVYLDVETKAHISTQFSRLCQKAGVTGKSFHCFRYSFLTSIVESGGTIEYAQQLAGHSSTKTTEGYISAIETLESGMPD